jgi:hypothetical protein
MFRRSRRGGRGKKGGRGGKEEEEEKKRRATSKFQFHRCQKNYRNKEEKIASR